MIVKSFWEYLLNAVYSVVSFVIIAGVFLLLVWICVELKRWYWRARLKRSETDFKELSRYMVREKKSVNHFQRILLAQTGIVFSTKFCIIWAILLVISMICGYLLGIYDDKLLGLLLSENARTIISAVILTFIELASILSLVITSVAFVKYARFLPFLLSSIVFAVFTYSYVLDAIVPLFSK